MFEYIHLRVSWTINLSVKINSRIISVGEPRGAREKNESMLHDHKREMSHLHPKS
jgi:hypothetical protein